MEPLARNLVRRCSGTLGGRGVYESAKEAEDARANPPPGQLFGVGGYRLRINCTCAGSPTVVIEAGLGDWSTSWSCVQRHREDDSVCTYDRAGNGWSEAGPQPRAAQQFVAELHALLKQANVPGPYVLVGHSLGGFTARLFAHNYQGS
jgi:pimeloyl-ACP methyl ester carboxylesterase